MIKGWHCFILYLAFSYSLAQLYAKAPNSGKNVDANKLLEKAEFIRNPTEDYVSAVELRDNKDGKIEVRSFESSIKGRDKALVRYLTPEIERDTMVLLLGQEMWVQLPKSAKPIRISAKQKLTGNAAYGDIVRLSFLGNYNAAYLRDDKFEKNDAVVLELKSIPGRPVTYDVIEYWISKGENRPLKVLYKTASGKVIREGTFADYQEIFGTQRPTTFILKNSLREKHVTTLKFSNNKITKLPDLLFEKQNLGRK